MRLPFLSSIKNQLAAIFLVFLFLPAIILGWVGYSRVYEGIEAEKINAVANVADVKRDQLHFMLLRARRRATTFISNLDRHCLNFGDASESVDSCYRRVLQVFVGNEYALGAYLYRGDAKSGIVVGEAAVRVIGGEDEFSPGQLAALSLRDQESRRYYSITVVDPQTGYRLSTTYPINLLEEIFDRPAALGRSGEVFLADGRGFFVTPARYRSEQGVEIPISANPMRRCLAQNDGNVLDLDYRDVPIVHGFRYIPWIGGGCIMAHIDQEEAFAPLKTLRWQAFAAALLFSAIGATVAFRFSGRLVAPLQNLLRMTRDIADGNYSAQTVIHGSDEISELARSFNWMAARLQQNFALLNSSQARLETLVNERTSELQTSEARQSAIFNAAPDAMIICDKHGTIVMVNRQTESLLGYPADELVGNTVEALVPAHLRTEHLPLRTAYAEMPDARVMGRKTQALRKDGSLVDVEISLSPIAMGKTVLFAGALRDISQRVNVEEYLARSLELLRHMGGLAKVGAWRLDIVTMALYWSEEIYVIHEVDAGFVPTLDNAIAFYAPEAQPLIRDVIEAAISEGTAWDLELPLVTAKGNAIWVRTQGSAVYRDGKIVALAGAFQDITKPKQTELELIKASRAADIANQAKSEFLANMSHEIRTPLNAIMGLIYLVLDSPLLPRQKDSLKKVYAASSALLNILNEILDYSKIEAGRLEIERTPVQIESLLRSVVDLFGMQIESKGLELFLDVAPDVPAEVLGDGLRLSQVLNNLVSNAIKFTERGEIIVGVERRPDDADQTVVERKDEKSERRVVLRFSVSDTGIGLTSAQIDHLFQPFVQANGTITRKHGGTGLGLAISQKLAGLMGGEIVVSSTEGKGARFYFDIPVGLTPKSMAYCDLERLGHMKVLAVDDYGSARLHLKRLLESWGFDVQTAESGDEALTRIEQIQGGSEPFDVVFLDADMPGIDGVETARRIEQMAHERGFGTPFVVMVVAGHEEETLRRSSATFFDDILTKPIAHSALYNLLLGIKTARTENRTERSGKRLWVTIPRFDGAHVLLVEDNAINQEVASSMLKRYGIVVTLANHGVEAIGSVTHQRFDAILMDLHMPIMDGFEAARAIRNLPQGRNIPIIALTAAVMKEDRIRCQVEGMTSFIAKPIDPDELIQVLKKCLPEHLLSEQQIEPPEWPHEKAGDPLFNLQGLDVQGALRRLGGDDQLLNRLLLNFAEEQADTASRLNALLAEGNVAEACALLHTLKGVADNLGATTLAQAAAQLEHEIKAGGLRPTQSVFNAIMETVTMSIRRHARSSTVSSGSEAAFDHRAAAQLLSDIAPFLQQHKLVPDELIQVLQRLMVTDLPGTPLARLLNRIDHIDYNGALDVVAEIEAVLNRGTRA